jgi:hypothetical protein
VNHTRSEPVSARRAGENADATDLLATAQIAELISTLAKTARAHQIYQANNPVYQRFVGLLREQFTRLWSCYPALELLVEENGFRWRDELFTTGEGRESLSHLFYKDGVRHLTFKPGFEEEVEDLLELLHRVRHNASDADDLLTLLWEREFTGFQYRYVDLLGEGLTLPAFEGQGSTGMEPADLSVVVRDDAADTPISPTAASAHGFEETLFFLDPSELAILQEEVAREWQRDLKAGVLSALFDRIEDPKPDRQREILGILRQLLPVLLSRGDLPSTVQILRELDVVTGDQGALGPELRAEAAELVGELSHEEVLGQLILLLETGAIRPDAEDLSLYFAHLEPRALPVLVQASETSTVPGVGARLLAAVDQLATLHQARVIDLFDVRDPMVIRGAARLCGRLRVTEAVPRLASVLARPEPDVRLAAVAGLAGIRTAPALDALQRALEDTDRDVRVAAARAIGTLRYLPARARLEAAIQATLKESDLTEKLALFEAYGAIGGGEAVGFLDKLLNGRGMLGRRQPSEVRACAALALGKLGTPPARAALQRSADESDAVVRSAVSRALRQEGSAR